jgi:ubiquinone/menaquinone biosynthesis C-methylase UbiE
MKSAKIKKKADQYDDPTHNYFNYWDGRDYENDAEILAIKRLLAGTKHGLGIDIGGGFGRLSPTLKKYCKEVVLVEPSSQQLKIAKSFLGNAKNIKTSLSQADQLPFADKSVDIAMVFRVIHHIPDPSIEFNEVARVLKTGGYFLIEFANYSNFKNRLKHAAKLKKMPIDPVDIRSEINKKKNDIAFVNHNPKTVRRQLAQAGFKVEKTLSVSNFRSSTIKKIVPKRALLILEKWSQPLLAKTYFGPSTVFLLKKVR